MKHSMVMACDWCVIVNIKQNTYFQITMMVSDAILSCRNYKYSVLLMLHNTNQLNDSFKTDVYLTTSFSLHLSWFT